jgi:hypothetical protein
MSIGNCYCYMTISLLRSLSFFYLLFVNKLLVSKLNSLKTIRFMARIFDFQYFKQVHMKVKFKVNFPNRQFCQLFCYLTICYICYLTVIIFQTKTSKKSSHIEWLLLWFQTSSDQKLFTFHTKNVVKSNPGWQKSLLWIINLTFYVRDIWNEKEAKKTK